MYCFGIESRDFVMAREFIEEDDKTGPLVVDLQKSTLTRYIEGRWEEVGKGKKANKTSCALPEKLYNELLEGNKRIMREEVKIAEQSFRPNTASAIGINIIDIRNDMKLPKEDKHQLSEKFITNVRHGFFNVIVSLFAQYD